MNACASSQLQALTICALVLHYTTQEDEVPVVGAVPAAADGGHHVQEAAGAAVEAELERAEAVVPPALQAQAPDLAQHPAAAVGTGATLLAAAKLLL
jgi:hypothetical protein